MQNTVESNYKCDICGREGQRKIYYCDEHLLLCPSCSEQLHTCRGCIHREKCGVELNPYNIPLYISQTINNENMTMVRQTFNPKLFEVYCKECQCRDIIAGVCMRQHCGFCTKWELHPQYQKKMEIE